MAAKALEGAVPRIFPSLGPALMISMGYIDLGKWVAAVEGGARFGSDLVLVALFFNFTAILCQYLATCIGTVAGKNLAEICSEEYSRLVCILLGVQAEISVIISELTTILGIAYGLNLLFAIDLLVCIFLAALGSVLIPFSITLLDNFKAEALYVSIAGSALAFYVFGVLISQPEIPLITSGIFPRLSGESAYSVMALLGANVMTHNFYIHSSIVQQRRRIPNISMGALFHDHFFAILFIFACIFLVNYVLMNSAATVFGSSDVVLNFQDVSLLMDQIFRSPVAPGAFFLVLLSSSQISSLSWNVGGQVIVQYFFGIDLSVWAHHLLVKTIAIIPALYCASSDGPEGLYQLLVFSQIILAMLLPASVIPLFRVASSKFIMGNFKISWYGEILALFAFLALLASNIIFLSDLLFGNRSWMSLGVGMESNVIVLYTFLLILCTSISLSLYLAVTPLKSSSDAPDTQVLSLNMQKDQPELSEDREDNELSRIKYEDQQSAVEEDALDKSIECQSDKSILEVNADMSETAIDSDNDSHQSVYDPNTTSTCISPAYHDKSKPPIEAEIEDIKDTVSSCGLPNSYRLQSVEVKDLPEKDTEVVTDTHTYRNNEEMEAFDSEESVKGGSAASLSECPGSSNSAKGNASDGSNGPGSLSKLSGLGRGARRQLTSVLDEFWGHLFDFHGKLTQEASARRVDVLLGLDLRTAGSSVKADTEGEECIKSYLPDAVRGSVFQSNSREYLSPNEKRIPNAELSFGFQMGSQPWSQSMEGLDTDVRNSCNNVREPSERQQLYPAQFADQPATIHGYQLASYLRGIGAGRNPYASSIAMEPPPTKSTSSFIANSKDPLVYSHGQNGLRPLGPPGFPAPAISRASRLQVERPYYESSLMRTTENVASSAHTKKYHTSPDISGIIASLRNSSLNGGNTQWASPISPQSSLSRMSYEQSQYLNPVSRAGVPLAFDELSPPKLHGDVFSSQSTVNADTKSLWSRQPFEQLFGMTGKDQIVGDRGIANRPDIIRKESFSYKESETKLLQSLRLCFMKLLKLEGSDWLFRQNGGRDEELIDRVAASERRLHEADARVIHPAYMGELQNFSSNQKFSLIQRSEEADLLNRLSLPNCGDGCIWRAALVLSFGVWCVRRILELSLVESRPELWGKYTYVLNRLQGILEPAFSKPRQPLNPCFCLEIPVENMKNSKLLQLPTKELPNKGSFTTASMILEFIKDVETAVSCRKGRTGTAAGDIAFPKGKENLASVLKRYKRRLLNKSPAANENSSTSRKNPLPSAPLVL